MSVSLHVPLSHAEILLAQMLRCLCPFTGGGDCHLSSLFFDFDGYLLYITQSGTLLLPAHTWP